MPSSETEGWQNTQPLITPLSGIRVNTLESEDPDPSFESSTDLAIGSSITQARVKNKDT